VAGQGVRGTAVALVLLVVAAVLWPLLAVGAADGELHDAPVLVVGPDVVTSAVAARAATVADPPLDVRPAVDAEQAERALDDGDAVAVLHLDLTGSVDRLETAGGATPGRERAGVDLVTELEAAYGRSARYDPRVPIGRVGAPTITAAAVGAGLLLVAVVSLLRGPVARSLPRGLARIGGLVLLGTAVGGLVEVAVPHRELAAVPVGAAVVAAGLLALALEVLSGLRGLVVAVLVLLVVPLPLVVAGDAWLLTGPVRAVTDWTLVGAAAESVAVDAAPRDRPALVLVGTLAVSTLVLVLWRATRAATARLRRTGREAEADADERALRGFLRVVLVVSAVLTVAASTWWPDGQGGQRLGVVSLASQTRCVPSGPVRDIGDLNRIARLRGSAYMQGGDVGASAELQDGRALWLFGDTLRDEGTPGGLFVRNSMIVVEEGCLRLVVPESGGAILADRGDGVGYWPMSVVVLSRPGYDLVTVTLQRVRTTDPGDPFGFEGLGAAVASVVVPLGGTPQVLSVVDAGPDDPDPARPVWGAATTVDGEWAHLYGTSRPADAALGTGFAVRVARTRVEDVARPSTWRYWDGASWVTDPDAAVELIGAEDGTSQTFSVFPYAGGWAALSKRDEVFGQDVVVWTAPTPTGPFAAAPAVAQLPSDAVTGTVRYMPLAHPWLLPRPGTMVVSFSQNRLDPAAVVEDPLLYRPGFLRVRLPDLPQAAFSTD
jgi:hypothetical protein